MPQNFDENLTPRTAVDPCASGRVLFCLSAGEPTKFGNSGALSFEVNDRTKRTRLTSRRCSRYLPLPCAHTTLNISLMGPAAGFFWRLAGCEEGVDVEVERGNMDNMDCPVQ